MRINNNPNETDDAALSETIDQLRHAIQDEPLQDSWPREFALIGLLIAVFGVVVWYAQLESRNAPIIAELVVNAQLEQDTAWVVPGFRQGLTTYLQAGSRVRVIEPTLDSSSLASQPEQAITAGLGFSSASWLVEVNLSSPVNLGRVTAELKLKAVDSLGDVQIARLHSDVSAISDLAARVALQVFDWLAIDPFSNAQLFEATAATPLASPAMEGFSRGLGALAEGDGRQAIVQFELALEAAPEHPIIHGMLAEAYELLGFRSAAQEQIEKAIETSEGLPREHRLAIEARREWLNHRWEGAADRYGALATFYPEEVRYGFAHARSLKQQHQFDKSQRILDQVERQNAADDPRVSLLRAEVFYRAGEWDRGLLAANDAVNSARTLGHRGTLAAALIWAAKLGEPNEHDLLDQANQLFAELENPIGQSQVLRQRGDLWKAKGALEKAEASYHAALEIAHSVGNDAELASGWNSLAIVRDLQGDLDSGLKLKRQVLLNYQRRNVQTGAGVTMEGMVISQIKLGRLADAQAQLRVAAKHFAMFDDAIGLAWIPYREAHILIGRGELDKARLALAESKSNAEDRPEGSLAEHTLFELAKLDYRTSEPNALATLRSSVAAYERANLDLDVGIARLTLSRQLRQLGDPNSELQLQQALEVFRASSAKYYLAQALSEQVFNGDLDACIELGNSLDGIGHRQSELVARVALHRCGAPRETEELLSRAIMSGELLEPKLALLSLSDPDAAKELGHKHGWLNSSYWQ